MLVDCYQGLVFPMLATMLQPDTCGHPWHPEATSLINFQKVADISGKLGTVNHLSIWRLPTKLSSSSSRSSTLLTTPGVNILVPFKWIKYPGKVLENPGRGKSFSPF